MLTTTWLQASPTALIVVALLWLPGLLVGVVARLRGLALAASAPLLSLGTIALAQAACAVLGVRWSVLPPLLTLVVVLAVVLAVQRLAGSVRSRSVGSRSARSRRGHAREGVSTGATAWTAPPRWAQGAPVALAATLSVIATAVPIMLAIGEPWRPQQSNDSPFHYTAVWRVLTTGSASWDTVFATSSPGAHGFYPVGFHGFVALVTQLSGQFLVVTTNVVVLALAALVWPLGLLAAVRALVPRSAAALWAVALLAPVVVSMPYLLLSFGALWPNFMALTLLPGLVAAALAGAAWVGGERRPGTGGLVGTVTVLGLGAFAVVFAHPSVALNAVVVLGPLLLAVLVRMSVRAWRASRRGRLVVVVGWSLFALAGLAGLAVLLRVGAAVAAAGSRNTQTLGPAVWRALTLATPLSPGLLVLGVLALVGAVRALILRRHRWLVVAHLLSGLQFVLAGATAGLPAAVLTGMWYRDAYRFAPVLAITSLLLAAVAVEGLVGLVARVPARARPGVPARLTARQLASVLVVLLVALAGRAPVDSHSAVRVVAQNYSRVGADSELVSPAELRLYADVLGPATAADRGPAGRQGVIGDPFGGAMFAGLYSDRPNAVNHFVGMLDPDRMLLVLGLKYLGSDPTVCATARRLNIGYVVDDSHHIWPGHNNAVSFAGLHDLAGVRGLTPIGRDGSVTLYRITGC